MATTTVMEVPESQRLIALSLGKIAASRGQKGGINLHKNLLVATVLTKARAAYMIQHMNAAKQRGGPTLPPTSSPHPPPPPSPSSSTCVEMKDVKDSTSSSTTTTTSTTSSPATSSSSPSPSATSSSPVVSAPSSPSLPSSASSTSSPQPAAPQSVTPLTQTVAGVPEGAAGSGLQVADIEDKENTPPPSPPSPACRGDTATTTTPSSLDCEKRLHGDSCVDSVKDKAALCPRPVVTRDQQTVPRVDHVSRPSTTCCLLKRRRAMDRDHENVSAPKVRIVEARVWDTTNTSSTTSASSTPEPMQCDSPQISNLVNIFNTSFSGLSGGAASGQSILSSVPSHKLSDNSSLTCAKEMSKGGLESLHHPLVLSV